MKFKKKRKCLLFNSLGNKVYLSLMKISYMVIGNSSSGVLETPSFGIRTINIGNRQSGRIISKNIINCDYSYKSITNAFFKIKNDIKNFLIHFLKKILKKNCKKNFKL